MTAEKWIPTLSRISYAITSNEPVYKDLKAKFWENAKASLYSITSDLLIRSTIARQKVVVFESTVREALMLLDTSLAPYTIDKKELERRFIEELRYEGPFRKGEILKKGLSKDWKTTMYIFIHSMSHKRGGYDALGLKWGGVMVKVCNHETCNVSRHIFDYMCSNVTQNKWLLYPRFVQKILNHLLKKLPPKGIPMTFSKLDSRFYTDLLRNHHSFSGKETPLFKKMHEKEVIPEIKSSSEESYNTMKRRIEGTSIPKKKIAIAPSHGEGLMRSARLAYQREQQRILQDKSITPLLTDEVIEVDFIARMTLAALRHPPPMQIEGTSRTNHSPTKNQALPPTQKSKQSISTTKKHVVVSRKDAPPPSHPQNNLTELDNLKSEIRALRKSHEKQGNDILGMKIRWNKQNRWNEI
ncbi:hypothetical protein L1987_06651 [Smallanthus sonchifolius]|uniref:Uncharacterized protein n=1 Tax=Smallanthus sonchifolius TaxID=185202 RepID=A0ACB9JYX6_9ASTR|nr:hypothetical protein L1987_06651 [Smallanthus sonchifolius]